MKAFIDKEKKSGYLGILFTLVFGFIFSTMFTPFIGILQLYLLVLSFTMLKMLKKNNLKNQGV